MITNLVLKRIDNRNCRNSEGAHKYFEKQKIWEILKSSFFKGRREPEIPVLASCCKNQVLETACKATFLSIIIHKK